MAQYGVAITKDQLSSLIDKALAGEEVVITRHGKPTVELRVVKTEASTKSSKSEVYERLRQFRETLPMSDESSTELICRMRDEGFSEPLSRRVVPGAARRSGAEHGCADHAAGTVLR